MYFLWYHSITPNSQPLHSFLCSFVLYAYFITFAINLSTRRIGLHKIYPWKNLYKKSNDRRRRAKLLGAYEPKTAEEIVYEYAAINQETVVDF